MALVYNIGICLLQPPDNRKLSRLLIRCQHLVEEDIARTLAERSGLILDAEMAYTIHLVAFTASECIPVTDFEVPGDTMFDYDPLPWESRTSYDVDEVWCYLAGDTRTDIIHFMVQASLDTSRHNTSRPATTPSSSSQFPPVSSAIVSTPSQHPAPDKPLRRRSKRTLYDMWGPEAEDSRTRDAKAPKLEPPPYQIDSRFPHIHLLKSLDLEKNGLANNQKYRFFVHKAFGMIRQRETHHAFIKVVEDSAQIICDSLRDHSVTKFFLPAFHNPKSVSIITTFLRDRNLVDEVRRYLGHNPLKRQEEAHDSSCLYFDFSTWRTTDARSAVNFFTALSGQLNEYFDVNASILQALESDKFSNDLNVENRFTSYLFAIAQYLAEQSIPFLVVLHGVSEWFFSVIGSEFSINNQEIDEKEVTECLTKFFRVINDLILEYKDVRVLISGTSSLVVDDILKAAGCSGNDISHKAKLTETTTLTEPEFEFILLLVQPELEKKGVKTHAGTARIVCNGVQRYRYPLVSQSKLKFVPISIYGAVANSLISWRSRKKSIKDKPFPDSLYHYIVVPDLLTQSFLCYSSTDVGSSEKAIIIRLLTEGKAIVKVPMTDIQRYRLLHTLISCGLINMSDETPGRKVYVSVAGKLAHIIMIQLLLDIVSSQDFGILKEFDNTEMWVTDVVTRLLSCFSSKSKNRMREYIFHAFLTATINKSFGNRHRPMAGKPQCAWMESRLMVLFQDRFVERYADIIVNHPDGTFISVLELKSFPLENILEFVVKTKPRPVWRGVKKDRDEQYRLLEEDIALISPFPGSIDDTPGDPEPSTGPHLEWSDIAYGRNPVIYASKTLNRGMDQLNQYITALKLVKPESNLQAGYIDDDRLETYELDKSIHLRAFLVFLVGTRLIVKENVNTNLHINPCHIKIKMKEELYKKLAYT